MHSMRTSAARAALAALALALAPAALAQSNDSTLSRHVKEADGTTGQDTNNGSGIKTGHLQDGAVTAPKLGSGAVGTAAVADGAVTAAKLAPGAVGTAAVADGAVTGAKLGAAAVGAAAIADGAVTPSKIAGPIPATKIDRTGLDADSLDGHQAGDFSPITHNHVPSEIQGIGAYQKRNRNVVVVAADGTGDFSDIAAAQGSITDASESNRYVMKIMPGEYAVPADLYLKQFIDIEGSGEYATKVVSPGYLVAPGGVELRDFTFAGASLYQQPNQPGVLRVSRVTAESAFGVNSMAVLDGVTITLYAPGTPQPTALFVGGGANATLRNCTISVTGGTQLATGILAYESSLLTLEGSRLTVRSGATSQALNSRAQTLTIRGSTITAEGISYMWSTNPLISYGNAVIEHSALTGIDASTTAPAALYNGGTMSIAHTRAEGRIRTAAGAPLRCIGVYDANFAPVTCP